MKQFKLLFILLVSIWMNTLKAQDTKLENTDIIYQTGHFSKAIDEYYKLSQRLTDSKELNHVYLQMARGYFQLNYKDSAWVYYQKVTSFDQLEAKDQFQLIQSAMAQQIDKTLIEKYIHQSNLLSTYTQERLLQALNYAETSFIEVDLYDSIVHDYHVIGQGNSIVYPYLYTALPFDNEENDFPYGITRLTIQDQGFVGDDSTHFWEETYFSVSPWVNQEETEIWYASNISERKKYNDRRIVKWGLSDHGSNPLKIYHSSKINGQWGKSDSLFEWEKDSFNYLHPYIDEQRDLLYFSSNRNGRGDYDLFYVQLNQSPQVVKALTKVNTRHNEIFPLVTHGYLVFSSDGRPGYGGYDLYYSPMIKLDKVQHLPAPINSPADDFNWVPLQQNHYVFSSDRLQQNGTDNWYLAELNWLTQLKISTKDQNGALPHVAIEVKGADLDTLIYTNEIGNVDLIVTDPNSYLVQAQYENQLLAQRSDAYLHDDILFVFTTPEWELPTLYFDFDEFAITPKADSTLTVLLAEMQNKKVESILLVGHTDNRGSLAYNQKLSEQRALAVKQWLVDHGINSQTISIQGKSYLEPVIKGQELTESEHQMNRRVEIIIQ